MVTAEISTSWKWRPASGILALLLAAGCAAPQGGPPPGAAPAAPAAAVAPDSVQPASVAPASAAPVVPATPERLEEVLKKLGVLGLPKGQEVRTQRFGTINGERAKSGTEAVLSWDERGLTVVFECEDKEIKAQKRARDAENIWEDDGVEVFLDRGRKRRQEDTLWVHVILSAAGVEYDECGPAKFSKSTGDPLNANFKWDLPGLKTKATVTQKGWRGEIFMPWESLGGVPAAGELWGFNLARGNWPESEFMGLYPTLGSFYTSDRWGLLAFLEKPVGQDPAALSAILSEVHALVVPKGGTGANIERFVSITGTPITNETTAANVRWDDQALIVTVDSQDAEVRAAPQARDDIDNIWPSNDTIEVFLDIGNQRDPRSDRWRHLIVSADGSLADQCGPMRWAPRMWSLQYGKLPAVPMGGNTNWNLAGLEVKTVRTKTGWQAELRLPWEGLGGQPRDGDCWGFNVARNNWDWKKCTSIQCLAPTFTYFLTIERWGTLLFVDQPLNLPPAAAAAVKLPAPGKDAPQPGVNLVANGDFSKAFAGWSCAEIAGDPTQQVVDVKGDLRFGGKECYIAIDHQGRPYVCTLPYDGLFTSQPFPLDPGCRYRFAMDMGVGAHGSNAKIFVEGYRWKPGATPHAGVPKPEELLLIYRSPPLVFRNLLATTLREQDVANPGAWARSQVEIPARSASLYDQRAWSQVQFGVVSIRTHAPGHVAGTAEAPGRAAIDNVVVERIE